MDTRIFSITEGHVAAEQYDHCQLLSVSLNELAIKSLLPKNPCIKYKTELDSNLKLTPMTATKSVKFNDIPQVFEYRLLYEEKFFKVHGYHYHFVKFWINPFSAILQNLKRWIWYC